jgi:kinesin family protein C2/C3
MGSVDGESEGIHAGCFVKVGIVFKEILLALRELLSDGTVMCHIVNTLIPDVLEGSWGNYASLDQWSGNLKKFLLVVSDMGLPGFSVKHLDEAPFANNSYAKDLYHHNILVP